MSILTVPFPLSDDGSFSRQTTQENHICISDSDDDDVGAVVSHVSHTHCGSKTLKSMLKQQEGVSFTKKKIHNTNNNNSKGSIPHWAEYIQQDQLAHNPVEAMKAADALYESYVFRRNTANPNASWNTAFAPMAIKDCINPFDDVGTLFAVTKWLQSWNSDSQKRVEEHVGSANFFQKGPDDSMRSSPRLRKSMEEKLLQLQRRPGYYLPNKTVTNTLIVELPPGSGVTTFLQVAAQEAGLRVSEVNTSQIRSTKGLQTLVNDVSQCHAIRRMESTATKRNVWDDIPPLEQQQQQPTSSNKQPPAELTAKKKKQNPPALTQDKINAFFGKKKPVDAPVPPPPPPPPPSAPVVEELIHISPTKEVSKRLRQEETVVVDDTPQQPAPNSKQNVVPIILFENADIVFDDETGFYSSIQNLSASTKCPLVITCTNSTCLPNIEGAITISTNSESLSPMSSSMSSESSQHCFRSWFDPTQYFFSPIIHIHMIVAANGFEMSPDDVLLLPNYNFKSVLPNLQFWMQHEGHKPLPSGMQKSVPPMIENSLFRMLNGWSSTDAFLTQGDTDSQRSRCSSNVDEFQTLFTCSLDNPLNSHSLNDTAVSLFSLCDKLQCKLRRRSGTDNNQSSQDDVCMYDSSDDEDETETTKKTIPNTIERDPTIFHDVESAVHDDLLCNSITSLSRIAFSSLEHFPSRYDRTWDKLDPIPPQQPSNPMRGAEILSPFVKGGGRNKTSHVWKTFPSLLREASRNAMIAQEYRIAFCTH